MTLLFLQQCEIEIDPIQVNEWKTVSTMDVTSIWLNMDQVVWSYINPDQTFAQCYLPDGKYLTTYNPKSISDIEEWLLINVGNLGT